MSAPTFALAEGLLLPADAVTQVFAFMGRRGSGKTYGAGRLVEQLADAGHQVVIVDPVGVWFGLRLAADGKNPGLSIPVFGGHRGDLPLPPTAGAVVANLVAERRMSAVLDVSGMMPAEQRRFVAEFCGALFQAKKQHRSAVMVVFEEAQEFVPQHVDAAAAKMVSHVQRLVRLGRNFGIGATLISQRPQSVNKEALNQAEVMLAFQLTGPQERKAITGWVKEKGAPRDDLGDELPSLKKGTAFVWSPEWLGVFGRYRILEKLTFDASKTPDSARAQDVRPLAPIDLDEVKAALAATIEEVAADDPKELRAEVARLRDEIERLRRAQPAPRVVDRPFVPAALTEQAEVLFHSVKAALSHADKLRTDISAAEGAAREIAASAPTPTPRAHPNGIQWNAAQWPAPAPAPAPARREQRRGDGAGTTRILRALAARGAPLTRSQIATLTGMAPTGGTLRTYLGALGTRGLIERTGDAYALTQAGAVEAGPVERAGTPRELIALWREKLPGKARDMLELLAAERELTRQQIAERLGLDLNGGTFRTYLGSLSANGLTQRGRNGLVRINPELAL